MEDLGEKEPSLNEVGRSVPGMELNNAQVVEHLEEKRRRWPLQEAQYWPQPRQPQRCYPGHGIKGQKEG